MEDAYAIELKQGWGFFGVFDGHRGVRCAAHAAKRLPELIGDSVPDGDAEMTKMVLEADTEFLRTGQPDGTTATFAFVTRAREEGGRHAVWVGNAGDSRTLLGRLDGAIVDGGGTDGGLTTDHKPDHPSERERIERLGGSVVDIAGVARVNGDLSVSRGLGDREFKLHDTGNFLTGDTIVSAAPEYTRVECDGSDFLLLVCDGISEGPFPNNEVVSIAAERVRAGCRPSDACEAVCRMAIERGSRDNVSCMMVTFCAVEGKDTKPPEVSRAKHFKPGPFTAPQDEAFRRAYIGMAELAGTTMAVAVEQRYEEAAKRAKELTQQLAGCGEEEKDKNLVAELSALSEELGGIGEPPGEKGSDERTEWFAKQFSGPECRSESPEMSEVPKKKRRRLAEA
eukprot:TRINITY_DN43356_c0_g1_i1.p1 TRINITY_DN43356_c0_g1~~TRINITY_DN43356_c0_g1_i1.p1  ORF type:complete len:451 (+),score=94.02 TRINITY_DN43356_c0_g1_i1:168-1355(+)